MNYIELIRGFWRTHEEHSFSTNEIALYFYLVEVSNICRWKNPFRRNNAKIQADLKINYNNLKTSRNKFRESGLLTYETKNGSPDVVYALFQQEGYKEVNPEKHPPVSQTKKCGKSRVKAEVQSEVATAKDKRNKTKTKLNKAASYEKITECWNATCLHQPKIKKLTEVRKKKIQQRWEEITPAENRMEIIREVFRKVHESCFMRGKNKNGWRATFDWVFENEQNMNKILEGNYDNRDSHHAPAGGNGHAARAEDRRRELDHLESLCEAVLQCDISPQHP